jgi:hypothetical protein
MKHKKQEELARRNLHKSSSTQQLNGERSKLKTLVFKRKNKLVNEPILEQSENISSSSSSILDETSSQSENLQSENQENIELQPNEESVDKSSVNNVELQPNEESVDESSVNNVAQNDQEDQSKVK